MLPTLINTNFESNKTTKIMPTDIHSSPINMIPSTSYLKLLTKEDELRNSQKEKLIQRFKQPISAQSTPRNNNANQKNRISKIFALSEQEERV